MVLTVNVDNFIFFNTDEANEIQCRSLSLEL